MVDDPNKLSENDSFMDEDDFLAADREEGEGSSDGSGGKKPNLKEIWAQNPSLKIFAIVAFIGVFLLGYLAFGSGDDKPQEVSSVNKTGDVSQPPGTAELPPAYEEAVRASNEQSAATAEQTGGSSIPTMIQRPSERIEAPVQVEETDPLSAWRREAESRRLERQQESENPATTTLLPTTTTPPVTTPEVSIAPNSTGNMGALNAAPAAQAPPPLPTGPSPEMLASMTAQLQQQMATVMETQVPKESVVVSMNIQPAFDAKKYATPASDTAAGNTTNASTDAGAASSIISPPAKPLISAGTIVYAQVLTEANSDVPGPVLAEVASGPLTGGRAIGQFSVAQRHLVLQFSRVVKNGVEYQVSGIALDPGTTLPGVATDINYHLFSRVFLPAAASFIQGFAQAATQQNTDTVVTNGTVITNNTQDLDTREELLQGVNEGAQGVGEFINELADRPVTIRVAGGTRIGILFIQGVYDPATAQGQQSPYPNQAQTSGLQNAYGQQQQSRTSNLANTATNAAFSTASSYLNGTGNNSNNNNTGYYNNSGSSTIYSGQNTTNSTRR